MLIWHVLTQVGSFPLVADHALINGDVALQLIMKEEHLLKVINEGLHFIQFVGDQ